MGKREGGKRRKKKVEALVGKENNKKPSLLM